MAEKIVVLNSGGFDSIVLMHYLYEILGEKDLYSLHFKYGANNEKQQLKCVEKVCEKFNIPNKVIELPKIDWTKGEFFTNNPYVKDSQYVEYRNMIFISYAYSFAESIGANFISLALLNIWDYKDTTPEFIANLNFIDESIQLYTPFINNGKERLGHIAKYLNIKEEEYFSCDKPKENGEPCGVCLDCTSLKKIII